MRTLIAAVVASGLLAFASAADASTIIVNVNSVSSLYQEFINADADPANTHEIRLAASGSPYRLRCATSGDTNTTTGSLKLTRGSVRLMGAESDENAAANFVIDGGFTGVSGFCASFAKVTGPGPNGTTFPSLVVRGVTFQNGASVAGFPAFDVRYGTLDMSHSHVFHTRALDSGATGGGAIYAFNSRVTINRSYFEDGATLDALTGGRCGGGSFGYGGSVLFEDSGGAFNGPSRILTILESTIRGSRGCRGGAVAYVSAVTSSLLMKNNTISGNTAVTMGGGLFLYGRGSAFLSANTIADNDGGTQDTEAGYTGPRVAGGIAFFNYTGTLTMKGNILAKNNTSAPQLNGMPTSADVYDCYILTPFTSNRTASFNLLGKQGNCTFIPTGSLVGTLSAPVDPRLGPFDSFLPMMWSGFLGMYTGLQPGSHAFAANGGTCEAEDERGQSRNSTGCDIGAYQTTCMHDPCVPGNNLTASCGDCVLSICNADPFCCQSLWDPICVNEVSTVCGLSCN